ncbi:hypothetical protein FDUTEX481_08845 [Tolypothrix sp. PCC 7601]|nr:hypothetical protein FDUTEX481_08845 [Tolypothrix sp. PCC 7601]
MKWRLLNPSQLQFYQSQLTGESSISIIYLYHRAIACCESAIASLYPIFLRQDPVFEF